MESCAWCHFPMVITRSQRLSRSSFSQSWGMFSTLRFTPLESRRSMRREFASEPEQASRIKESEAFRFSSISAIHVSIIASARSTASKKILPYSLSRMPRPVRSKSWNPMSASSRLMEAERDGCVIFNFSAARLMCSVCAATMKYFNAETSMAFLLLFSDSYSLT